MKLKSKYYNVAFAKEGDVIKIVTEPVLTPTQWGEKLKCNIELDGDTMEWTLSNTAQRSIMEVLGNDTSDWVKYDYKVKIDTTKQGVKFVNVTPVIREVQV